MYYTQNCDEARESVRRLAKLEIELVVTGHGPAMQGPEMRGALQHLSRNFDQIAVRKEARYVSDPVRAETGTAYPAA